MPLPPSSSIDSPPAASSPSPLGPCPKCGYPIDPGTCPECGTVTDDPELLREINREKVRWLQAAKWRRRATLLSLIPVASALLIALSMVIIAMALGPEAETWMQTSGPGRVYGQLTLVLQFFGTPILILTLAILALARDHDIPKGDWFRFLRGTFVRSAIGFAVGFGILIVGVLIAARFM